MKEKTRVQKKKAIIVDLDGTLADIKHRLKYIETPGKKDFQSFNQGIMKDKVNVWCREIIERFHHDHAVLFITGRMWNDVTRDNTIRWLFQHDIMYSNIYARKEGDFRKDAEIKKEIYIDQVRPHFDVLFCLDDRTQVVDMWREMGLVCLQCDKGDF